MDTNLTKEHTGNDNSLCSLYQQVFEHNSVLSTSYKKEDDEKTAFIIDCLLENPHAIVIVEYKIHKETYLNDERLASRQRPYVYSYDDIQKRKHNASRSHPTDTLIAYIDNLDTYMLSVIERTVPDVFVSAGFTYSAKLY